MIKYTFLNALVCFVVIMLIFMPPVFTKAQKDSVETKIKALSNLDIKAAKTQLRSILPIQRIILESQERQISANQDTILMLRKGKRVVKIRYVKIYKTFPIFVPVVDSSAYITAFRDTLNDYFLDTITRNKRPGFLNRLIHRK